MQGSYSAARQAGGRAAGQLLPHTTAVARSKAQQQRQQLQQRWQQQAQQQQQRPATAPAAHGRCGASSLDTCEAIAEEEDCGCSNTDSDAKQLAQGWQDQQQQAAPSSRPSTAAAAAHAAPRNRRQQAAQTAGNSSTIQQQQQQQLQGVATRAEACSPLLQPTDVEHVTEAQSWVQNWPEAVGNTRLLTALITAHQYTFNSSSSATSGEVGYTSSSSTGDSIDSYYLFSDGLADDAAACLEWVRQQEEAGQPLRPVHTVGEWMLLLLCL
jgi:hypothetical protein